MSEGRQDTEDSRDAKEYFGIEDRCENEGCVTTSRSFRYEHEAVTNLSQQAADLPQFPTSLKRYHPAVERNPFRLKQECCWDWRCERGRTSFDLVEEEGCEDVFSGFSAVLDI